MQAAAKLKVPRARSKTRVNTMDDKHDDSLCKRPRITKILEREAKLEDEACPQHLLQTYSGPFKYSEMARREGGERRGGRARGKEGEEQYSVEGDEGEEGERRG